MEIQSNPLENIALFNSCSKEVLDDLTAKSVIRSVHKNTILIMEGDIPHSIYFILQGSVRVFCENKYGKEITLQELGAGESFGKLASLYKHPSLASVITKSECKILIIHSSDFEKFYTNRSELSEVLSQQWANKIARLSHHLKVIALESINERVYWALERYSSKDKDLIRTSRATHKELANLIGCSRESVSRALQELREEGKITIDGNQITLCGDADKMLSA